MIRRLRCRFIAAAMAATFAVLFIMIGGMNLLNYHRLVTDADRLTHMVADHDGHFETKKPQDQPEEKDRPGESGHTDPAGKPDGKMPAETPYTTRYFSVLVTDDDTRIIDLDHIASVKESQASTYAKTVAERGTDHGFYRAYRYRTVQTTDGTMVIFVDCEAELDVFGSTLAVSVLMSFAGYAAVFVLVLLSSGIVLRPVRESYEKQKQFITDASHELKTPLTIIDANVEILELEHGEDEWTDSIHNQIRRLSGLTNQLVTLARMDEEGDSLQKEDFDLTEAVYDTAKGYQSVAQTRELRLQLQLSDAVICHGQESRVRQLVGILLDNAFKYATDGSSICVKLYKKGRQSVFEISNEADGLTEGEKPELFERFYRSDASRNSKTGGSGIGLAVAQAIVTAHKGTIRAFSPDGKRLHVIVTL